MPKQWICITARRLSEHLRANRPYHKGGARVYAKKTSSLRLVFGYRIFLEQFICHFCAYGKSAYLRHNNNRSQNARKPEQLFAHLIKRFSSGFSETRAQKKGGHRHKRKQRRHDRFRRQKYSASDALGAYLRPCKQKQAHQSSQYNRNYIFSALLFIHSFHPFP